MAKKLKDEVLEQPIEQPAEDDKEARRNTLIQSLRELLVNKRDMVIGGREVRSRVNNETTNYAPVLEEINKLGLELGYSVIGYGQIRRG